MSIIKKTKRITIDLPEKIHRDLKIKASRQGVTMKQIIIDLLKQDKKNVFLNGKAVVREQPKPLALGITDEQINSIRKDSWKRKL